MESAHKVGRSLVGERRKILVLGAGFVSGPVVDYLCRNDDVDVTVGTSLQEDVEKLMRLSAFVRPEIIDVKSQTDKLEKLIDVNNLVISLLPSALHPAIAKMCIKYKTSMVTASYQSSEMLALHNDAKNAGITIINEVGMDPGIDHMLTMDVIDATREQGGKVKSLVSWCGRLPSPEASENPLRYKFSWNPLSVFTDVFGGAKYLKHSKVTEIPKGGAILDNVVNLDFMPGFHLEGFPNRDSTVYGPLYNLQGVTDLMRATIRYKGFSEAMKGLLKIGLFDTENHQAFDPFLGPDMTWKNLLAVLMNLKPDVFIDTLKSKVAEKFGGENTIQYETLDKLGFFGEDVIVERKATPLATVCNYLTQKLTYEPHERDMCIMRHDVRVQMPDASEKMHHIDFVSFGDPKRFSAISSTVGYTTAIIARMILNGEIQKKGVILPMSKDIYRPVLKRLKEEGIVTKTRTVAL